MTRFLVSFNDYDFNISHLPVVWQARGCEFGRYIRATGIRQIRYRSRGEITL